MITSSTTQTRASKSNPGRPKTKRRTKASPPAAPQDEEAPAGAASASIESPYLPIDGLSLVLTGDWRTGGLLELLVDGEVRESYEFAAAPWSVLANLSLAAIRSQSSHWFDSFVSTAKLETSLDQHRVLALVVPEKIYKLINQIRSKLAISDVLRRWGGGKSGVRSADCLIRSRKGCGYRIALPPKSLTLRIDGTLHDAANP